MTDATVIDAPKPAATPAPPVVSATVPPVPVEPAAPATPATPATPAAAAPAEPPAFDWRKEIAGDDEKLYKHLERTPDLKTLHKRLEDSQKELKDSGRVKLPGKDATDQDRAAFNQALGVPEKPDAYNIKLDLPDGVALDDNDKAELKQITEYLHSKGGVTASPETVKHAHELYLEMRESRQAALVAKGEMAHQETLKALKTEWGADFKNNVGFANAAVTGLFGKEIASDILNTRLEDGTRLGDFQPFLKAMNMAGRQLAQDPLFLPTNSLQGDPKTLTARKQEIMALRTGTTQQQKLYASPEIQQELDTILAREIAAMQGKAA